MKPELFIISPEMDYEPNETRLAVSEVAQAPGAQFTFTLTPPTPQPRIMVRCKECPNEQWAFRYGTIEMIDLVAHLTNHSALHSGGNDERGADSAAV